MQNIIRIATRQSPLALWQANFVGQQLQRHYPNLTIELVKLVTRGDQLLTSPLAEIGGKGLFIKELEYALLQGMADIAVHSMKDVPIELFEPFTLTAICQRADPHDALISNHYPSLAELPLGSLIGTSSLRRQCQLKALRPDLTVRHIRGNVQTRLAKLDKGEFDAIILASAGLQRLGLSSRITETLSIERLLPAVGQGAIGIECCADDQLTQQLMQPLNDELTSLCVSAERAMNQHLNGGCQVPIAGFAMLQKQTLYLRGLVGSTDGRQILRAEANRSPTEALLLGQQVAELLLAQGAAELLSYSAAHQ